MTQPLSFAVIGHPVAHSRSPQIHTAFAAQFGIALVYERIDSPEADFEVAVERFFGQSGSGLNVTVPFKERAWQMASARLSARARDAGAVNTLWLDDGQLHGCNTDGVGLVNDLIRLDMPVKGARVLMVGAGGAARGVLGPLLKAGVAHIHVVNRNTARAQSLLDAWVLAHPQDTDKLQAGGFDQVANLAKPDLIINATSSSLQNEELPLPASVFGSQVCAYDMMYGDQPTAFMQQAQQAGSHQVADGLGMLVGQASESFLIWHGCQPNIEPVITQIRAQIKASVR